MESMDSGYQLSAVLTESQYMGVNENHWEGYHSYGQDLVQACVGNTTAPRIPQEYAGSSGDCTTNPSQNYPDHTQEYVTISGDYNLDHQTPGQPQVVMQDDGQGYYMPYYYQQHPQPRHQPEGPYTTQDENHLKQQASYEGYSYCGEGGQDGQYPTGWEEQIETSSITTNLQNSEHFTAAADSSQHLYLNYGDNTCTSLNPGSLDDGSSPSSEQDLDLMEEDLDETGHSTEHVMIRDKARNNFKKFRGAPVRKVYQRQAANVRERRRMRTINEAFENLRQNVPSASDDKKTSKVDTLKLAIQYIGDLTQVLQSCGDINLPGLRERRGNNKIIVSYTVPDVDPENGSILCGHSLSWQDNKRTKITEDNKLCAPLWYPLLPTPEDLKSIEAD